MTHNCNIKRETDVLSGGAGNDDHFCNNPGNIFFKELIGCYHHTYTRHAADRNFQRQIVQSIVAAVAARFGRFFNLNFHPEHGLWLWNHVQGDLLQFVIRQTLVEASGAIDIVNKAISLSPNAGIAISTPKDSLRMLSLSSRRSGSSDFLEIIQERRRNFSDSNFSNTDMAPPPSSAMLPESNSPRDVKMVSPNASNSSDRVNSWLRTIEYRMNIADLEN